MSSSSFQVASLGFSIYSIMSSAVTVLLLLFQFEFLLFLFLLWVPWLGLPKLCWIIVARVDISVSFLILEEMLSVFNFIFILSLPLARAVFACFSAYMVLCAYSSSLIVWLCFDSIMACTQWVLGKYLITFFCLHRVWVAHYLFFDYLVKAQVDHA